MRKEMMVVALIAPMLFLHGCAPPPGTDPTSGAEAATQPAEDTIRTYENSHKEIIKEQQNEQAAISGPDSVVAAAAPSSTSTSPPDETAPSGLTEGQEQALNEQQEQEAVAEEQSTG